nr:hypothetical protein LKV13_04325 [Borrelia sp. BU AG58]
MKLTTKVLMIIISLVSVITSCKLYDAMLDKLEDSLKSKEGSSESRGVSVQSSDSKKANGKTDVQNGRGRIGSRAGNLGNVGAGVQEKRAADEVIGGDDEIGQGADARNDKIVLNNLDNGDLNKRQTGSVINQFSKEAKESEDIRNKARSKLEEINKISGELKKTRERLDEIKNGIKGAESDFQHARKNSESFTANKKELLPTLNQAIKKAKTSRNAAENATHSNADLALTHARNKFNTAIMESDNVLRDITTSYPYIWDHYSNTKNSIKSAEEMLKKAKEYQNQLNSSMEQVEKDFAALERIYKEFKNQP